MKPLELAVSTCGAYPTEELFREYEDACVGVAEICPPASRYTELHGEGKRVAADAAAHGVRLWSYHLPFGTWDKNAPCSLNDDVRDHTYRLMMENLRCASEMEIGVAVMHSGVPYPQSERGRCLERAKEFVFRLQTEAEPLGVRIALESLLPSVIGRNTDELTALTSVHPKLGVCFDVNHLLVQSHTDFIDAMGEKIITTHISDYDFIDERHWMPGEGSIDWQELIGALRRADYKGPFMYEIGFPGKNATITRRPLTVADFRENYETLMSGKLPAAVGTPVGVAERTVFSDRYFSNFGVELDLPIVGKGKS